MCHFVKNQFSKNLDWMILRLEIGFGRVYNNDDSGGYQVMLAPHK